YRLKTTVPVSQIAPPLPAKYIWPQPPNGPNNPCLLSALFLLFLAKSLRRVQSTFFLALVFPPPAARAEVLPLSHCPCAGRTAYTGESFVVQGVVRYVMLFYEVPNIFL